MGIKRKIDESTILKENAMLKVRPNFFYEWDFEKNDKIGLDVYKITFGSAKKAWWKCPECDSSYDMSINNRTANGSGCSYCSGKRVNITNSLLSIRPDVASEWHPTKNGKLTPPEVTHRSGEKVWWLARCGHEWDAVISSRTGSVNATCPYCSNQKVLIGYNDMWTTNPELAKLLADSEDGFKYMQTSERKIDWICQECNNVIKGKRIGNIKNRGLFCPSCSDNLSFPEKFMYSLLRVTGIDFIYNETLSWTNNFRYDFYLPEYNWIIEVHGKQHYGSGFEALGGRTLVEEQENDNAKEQLARENGIDKYIIIDARIATTTHISLGISTSDLLHLIGKNVDYVKIGQMANKTLVVEACDLWNSGIRNSCEIAEKMRLERSTISSYLKRGAEIGWCDYCPKEVMQMNMANAINTRKRPVVQLDREGSFIREWISATEAGRVLMFNRGNIPLVCKGKAKTSYGYKWIYKEDYDKMIQEGLSHKEYMDKYYPKIK